MKLSTSGKIILSIDTSTAQGSVALFSGDQLLAEQSWFRQKSHGELVTARIEELVRNAELTVKDLELIAVDVGPGSFTGIRVGVNIAKTLSYALGIPVAGYNSLETLAAGIPLEIGVPILTALDAHDGHFFYNIFTPGKLKWKPRHAPKAATYAEISEIVQKCPRVVSDALERVSEFIPTGSRKKTKFIFNRPVFPNASTLGRLVSLEPAKPQTLDWKNLAPLYVRPSGAEEKLKKK